VQQSDGFVCLPGCWKSRALVEPASVVAEVRVEQQWWIFLEGVLASTAVLLVSALANLRRECTHSEGIS
jgi:hypothetical protein